MWWRSVPLEIAMKCLIIELQSVFPSQCRLITRRTANVTVSKVMIPPPFTPTTKDLQNPGHFKQLKELLNTSLQTSRLPTSQQT